MIIMALRTLKILTALKLLLKIWTAKDSKVRNSSSSTRKKNVQEEVLDLKRMMSAITAEKKAIGKHYFPLFSLFFPSAFINTMPNQFTMDICHQSPKITANTTQIVAPPLLACASETPDVTCMSSLLCIIFFLHSDPILLSFSKIRSTDILSIQELGV